MLDLFVDALQTAGFWQLGRVVVVPPGVPGQGGRPGEGGHLWGAGHAGVGPRGRGAPAAVRVAQDFALACARPQTCKVGKQPRGQGQGQGQRACSSRLCASFALRLSHCALVRVLSACAAPLTVCRRRLLLVHVRADVGVAVVKVAVALAAVLAADVRVPGRDGGERVALPDGDGTHCLLAVARQRAVTLLGTKRKR